MRLRTIILFTIATLWLFPALIRAQEKQVVVPSYQKISLYLDKPIVSFGTDIYVHHSDHYLLQYFGFGYDFFAKIKVGLKYGLNFVFFCEVSYFAFFAIGGYYDRLFPLDSGRFVTLYYQPFRSERIGKCSADDFTVIFDTVTYGPLPEPIILPHHFSVDSTIDTIQLYMNDTILFYPEHSLNHGPCSKWYLNGKMVSTEDTLLWIFQKKEKVFLRSVSTSDLQVCPNDSIVSEIHLQILDRKDFTFWDTLQLRDSTTLCDTSVQTDYEFVIDTLPLHADIVLYDTLIEKDTVFKRDTLWLEPQRYHRLILPDSGVTTERFLRPSDVFTNRDISSRKTNIRSPLISVPTIQHLYIFPDTNIPFDHNLAWGAALKMDSSIRTFLYATPFKDKNDLKLPVTRDITVAFYNEYKDGVFPEFVDFSWKLEFIKDSILGELAYACKKSCHIHHDSIFYEIVYKDERNYLPPRHLKHKERPLHLSLHYGESRTFVAEEPSPQGCARWYWNDSLIAYGDTLQKEFADSGSFKLSLATTNEYMDCATDSILSDVWIDVGPRPRVCCDTLWTTDTIRIFDTLVLFDTLYRQDTLWIFDTLHLPFIIRQTDTIYVIDTLYQSQFRLQAPTAIAPLGREENRLFRFFDTEEVVQMQLHIYDRWGKLLHQVIGPPDHCTWDASHNRKAVAAGTYLWVVRWKDRQGGWHTDRGWVSIIL